MGIRPQIVHDGVETAAELDPRDVSAVVSACPRCSADVAVDPLAVVRDGTSVAWATSPEVDALQELVLHALPLTVATFGGHRSLRGTEGCAPHAAPVTCPSCGARLLAVVSYGEVQPARWWIVVEGLVLQAP